MFTKWQWLFDQFRRTVSARVTLYLIVAVATALMAVPLQSLPFPHVMSVAAESVDSILKILASSMLTVTTFSLSVMVSAFSAASATATPRATSLLQEDPTTHRVLGTFIGAFLFSLVGIIALSMGIYNDNGRIILFAVTLVLVLVIVVTILNWIEHLSILGRVGETADRVEKATACALELRVKYPHLGAKLLNPDNPPAYINRGVVASGTGYIQHIDMNRLNDLGEEYGVEISVIKSPGNFVHPAEVIAAYDGDQCDALAECIEKTFTIDNQRSFDQDPRFGLEVLTEIASRALSPAVNDPGTAIDVIGRTVRLLVLWCDYRCLSDDDENIQFPNVRAPAVATEDLFEDIYLPISRDGAGILEVNVRLLKSLISLKQISPDTFGTIAEMHAEMIVERAQQALRSDREQSRMTELLRRIKQESSKA